MYRVFFEVVVFLMLRGYFRSVLSFMMILTVSGVICGEGLRLSTSTDRRTQTGGSWGLGGLGGSTGLLSRSLQYSSDMKKTGVGSRAKEGNGNSSANVGGLSGGYSAGSSVGRNSYVPVSVMDDTKVTGSTSNTQYTAKTIDALKPSNLGTYKPGADYSNMMNSFKNELKPNVGKYDIASAGDVSWDRKDTLESQLTGSKKYGMKADESIARSDAYMNALAASGYIKNDDNVTAMDSAHITTLVPKNGGEFSELIKRGEAAFKAEQYQEAMNFFKLARRISPRSPEVLLSLFHTSFAASSGLSYSLPAYYLQFALKYFPELPLADVKPKYFYAREGDFVRDQVRLEKYIDEQGRDPQALFIMGYIEWRNDEVPQACKNLQNAYDLSQDSELQEAISILWDGMVASGKVKDKLVIQAPKKTQSPTTAPVSDGTK